MKGVKEIPKKAYFKLPEVCELTDTQPYVLRFWESEFPQLAPEKSRSGQPIYRRGDLDLILRIKQLLYEEEYTIAGARQRLEQESGRKRPMEAGDGGGRRARPRSEPEAASAAVGPGSDVAALRAEIESLRERLERAEAAREEAEARAGAGDPEMAAARVVAAEAARAAAERALEIRRARGLEVAERLEELLDRLDRRRETSPAVDAESP